jgi:nitrogen fixation NifU-like protein
MPGQLMPDDVMPDQLRDLYQEVILDHGRNPRNCRHPEAANRKAQGDNPLCGDRLTVYLTVDNDGRITDAAFEGRGCAISMASSSLMTEVVRGKTREQALALVDCLRALVTPGGDATGPAEETERLRALSGVRDYPVRIKCATLPWQALSAALAAPCEAVCPPLSGPSATKR